MSVVLAVDAFCVVSKGSGLQHLLFCCVAEQPEADSYQLFELNWKMFIWKTKIQI